MCDCTDSDGCLAQICSQSLFEAEILYLKLIQETLDISWKLVAASSELAARLLKNELAKKLGTQSSQKIRQQTTV